MLWAVCGGVVMILMGFDVSNVPTADVMELAASLLELDQRTIARLVKIFGWSAPPQMTEGEDHNLVLARLLRERAATIRALETLATKRDLDS